MGRISEDTTGALDAYFDFLYQGCLEVPAHEDNIQTIISHHTAMRKTTTEKKLTFGRVKYDDLVKSQNWDGKVKSSICKARKT